MAEKYNYKELTLWAAYLREAFNTLVANGFTEEQAFELLKAAVG